MKLEVTMKEMQELVSKKGQVEIMGKTYVLNPQDELLIKFIMDYKEKRPMDYYDIISTLFNNALIAQPAYGYQQPIYPQQAMWSNGCYPAMQQFMNQAPQMSYEDMKNMYKRQFAAQLGLDIDGDEEEHPCTCCSNCDGNCEENIALETTEEEKEIAKDIVNKAERIYKGRLFDGDISDEEKEEIEKGKAIVKRVNEIYQKCRENGEMDDESKKELEEIGYKLGYKDGYKTGKEYGHNDGKQDYTNGIAHVQTIPNTAQFDPELLQSKIRERQADHLYKLYRKAFCKDDKQEEIESIVDIPDGGLSTDEYMHSLYGIAENKEELLIQRMRYFSDAMFSSNLVPIKADINDKLNKLDKISTYGVEGRRFTGKKDKNGNNIYEGDILKCKLHSGKYENYLVSWNFEEASFEALNHDESNFMSPSIWNEFEVIGNITDNPELMKEGLPKGKPVVTQDQLRPYKAPLLKYSKVEEDDE